MGCLPRTFSLEDERKIQEGRQVNDFSRNSWNICLFSAINEGLVVKLDDGFFRIDVAGWRLFWDSVCSIDGKSLWLMTVDVTNWKELVLSEGSSPGSVDCWSCEEQSKWMEIEKTEWLRILCVVVAFLVYDVWWVIDRKFQFLGHALNQGNQMKVPVTDHPLLHVLHHWNSWIKMQEMVSETVFVLDAYPFWTLLLSYDH